MAVALNPYIHFNGEAEKAVEFYKSIFGGELTISRYKDNPGPPPPDEFKEQIMHSMLKNEDFQFMVGDSGPMGAGKMGENVSMSLSGPDEDAQKLRGYFNGLKKGGTVTVELAKAPWGDEFGMLVDKFGIKWMINIGKSI